MIRMYREEAESVHIALQLLKQLMVRNRLEDYNKQTLAYAYEAVTGNRYRTMFQGQADPFSAPPGDPLDICANRIIPRTLDDLSTRFSGLMAQQQQPTAKRSDAELIDWVIEFLKLPFLHNRLTHATLDKLRRVILVPEELAQLKDAAKTVGFMCVGCRREIQAGDMITLSVNGAGEPQLMCTMCQMPETVVCQCGKRKKLGDLFFRRIRKESQCTCDATATPAPARDGNVVAPPDQGVPAPDPNFRRRTGGGAAW